MRHVLFFLIFLVFAYSANAAEWPPTDHLITGPATYIVDGDTLDVGKTRIRLWGINTPERKQAGYQDAKQYLSDPVRKEITSLIYAKKQSTEADTMSRNETLDGFVHDILLEEPERQMRIVPEEYIRQADQLFRRYIT